ncbi:MAG: hypothetical protein JRF02_00755 [Deltaproteobacteria bacterium]|jgi:hypothetical protein|nr:hypothetical protein [Deltaproteobacteria bacterium]
MTLNHDEKEIFADQLNAEEDRNIPKISFLDDLDADSLKLVELIMAAGTGQKDIIRQLRHTASAHRSMYAE